jgi:choline dehydrogenase-like flavoprotein
VPKGFGLLLKDPRHVWGYEVEPEGGLNAPTYWLRGSLLGGSSSVNGMIYTRGEPENYEEWRRAGLTLWGWDAMSAAFIAIESHAEGANATRGGDGPLHVSPPDEHNPVCDAFIQAGVALGVPRKHDLNDAVSSEGVGYCTRTIRNGRRVSAASAFLKPALTRRNLTIVTGAQVDRLVMEAGRAAGVAYRNGRGAQRAECAREVILCAGALNSPRLLQLSGVGAPDTLAAAGVTPVVESPRVGLGMREHLVIFTQFRLAHPRFSHNRELRGMRLLGNAAKYLATKRGVLAQSAYQVGAFVRSSKDVERADIQLLMAPFSLNLGDASAAAMEPEQAPGLQCIALPVRPMSEGMVTIRSPDPSAPMRIKANFLSDENDRRTAVAAVRFVRRLMKSKPMSELVHSEVTPGADVESDADILAAYRRYGSSGYHAVGTCAMGVHEDSVTDPRLRVRGVAGLRVVDCSVMPTIPSGNTNGPVMALAWRAADLILEDAA